jgi:hypothetical protein
LRRNCEVSVEETLKKQDWQAWGRHEGSERAKWHISLSPVMSHIRIGCPSTST